MLNIFLQFLKEKLHDETIKEIPEEMKAVRE